MDISAIELKEKIVSNEHIYLIDVREELEYHTYNIGGQNIPIGKLPQLIEDLDLEKSDEIIVICQRGIRSTTAQKILETAGFTNIRNLQGGIQAYRRINN